MLDPAVNRPTRTPSVLGSAVHVWQNPSVTPRPAVIPVSKCGSYPAVPRHSVHFLPSNTGSRHTAGQESKAVGPAPAPPTLRTTSVTHADAAGVTRRVEWLSAGLIRSRCRRPLVGQRRARSLIRRNHQSLRRRLVRNALVRELPPSPVAAPEPTCPEPPWRTRSSRRRAKKATTPGVISNRTSSSTPAVSPDAHLREPSPGLLLVSPGREADIASQNRSQRRRSSSRLRR